MSKKTPERKSAPADSLLKTSKKKDIELTERELDKVSGGQSRAGGGHLKEATITN
jgi:hypothetical protein